MGGPAQYQGWQDTGTKKLSQLFSSFPLPFACLCRLGLFSTSVDYFLHTSEKTDISWCIFTNGSFAIGRKERCFFPFAPACKNVIVQSLRITLWANKLACHSSMDGGRRLVCSLKNNYFSWHRRQHELPVHISSSLVPECREVDVEHPRSEDAATVVVLLLRISDLKKFSIL